LLFFDKGKPTKDVWYFDHPYPNGIKNYNKSKPISIKEFDLEKKWWKKRVENEYAWKVNIAEIKQRNYNLDFKNPIAPEEEKRYGSKELLDMLSLSFEKSNKILKEIKANING
jgi:type I restriction enzyme M protein